MTWRATERDALFVRKRRHQAFAQAPARNEKCPAGPTPRAAAPRPPPMPRAWRMLLATSQGAVGLKKRLDGGQGQNLVPPYLHAVAEASLSHQDTCVRIRVEDVANNIHQALPPRRGRRATRAGASRGPWGPAASAPPCEPPRGSAQPRAEGHATIAPRHSSTCVINPCASS